MAVLTLVARRKTNLFAMGLLLTAVTPTAGWAAGLGMGMLIPLLFFGGLWVPRENLPALLRTIGDFTPLGASTQAMQATMQGAAPPIRALCVLAAYVVAFGFAAVRFFRWE
jgi:ABC-2 type transport system permease protein